MPKVKELREKKARHQQALQLAQYLCNQIASGLPEKEASRIFEFSMMMAAQRGISEVVEMIITLSLRLFMILIARLADIFLIAASRRFENVFNIINRMSDRKYLFFGTADINGNNLLHICGKLAPPHRLNIVDSAALQMQHEL